MSVLLIIAVAVLIVLGLERAHRSAPPLQPKLIGDAGVDRDRQRVLDDLRWLTQAELPAPTPQPGQVEAAHRDGDDVLPPPPTIRQRQHDRQSEPVVASAIQMPPRRPQAAVAITPISRNAHFPTLREAQPPPHLGKHLRHSPQQEGTRQPPLPTGSEC